MTDVINAINRGCIENEPRQASHYRSYSLQTNNLNLSNPERIYLRYIEIKFIETVSQLHNILTCFILRLLKIKYKM